MLGGILGPFLTKVFGWPATWLTFIAQYGDPCSATDAQQRSKHRQPVSGTINRIRSIAPLHRSFMKTGLPPFIVFLLIVSVGATFLIWRRIFLSDSTWYSKILHAAFAAVPFFGPMLYVFLMPPPRHPPASQMPLFPKGTEVHPSFGPLIRSIGRVFDSRSGGKR